MSDATEIKVVLVAGAGIAHFSTHGLLNMNDPLGSALAFSEIGQRAAR